MRFRVMFLALAVVVVGAAVMWSAFQAGTAFGGRSDPSGSDGEIPAELGVENLPDRVGVTSSDGNLAGYVDKELLLALTRDLPVPDGYDVRGPFPVYDEDGVQVGSYHHDRGFLTMDGENPGPGYSPVTTARGRSGSSD